MYTEIFDSPQLWKQYGLTPDYEERIKLILDMLPGDINSLLDIGCGKGEIINSIRSQSPRLRNIGLDISHEALTYVDGLKIVGELPKIPLKDRDFDLVICLQVLEHIPNHLYQDSLREIERLSNRYLIVGVPFRENLRVKQVMCATCMRSSHSDGHLHSYDHDDMRRLFKDFELQSEVLAGVVQPRKSQYQVWIDQNIGGYRYQPATFHCPYCGHSQPVIGKEHPLLLRKAASTMSHLLADKQDYPYWIISMYERKAGEG